MAATMVPLNIVNALVKAIDYLKASDWKPATATQRKFLEEFYAEKKNFHRFDARELRAWADTVAENLNRILEEEGFAIRFDSFGPGEFGVLSILDVAVAWLKEGRVLPPSGSARSPRVYMEDYAVIDGRNTALFTGFETEAHRFPIACVPTKSGDVVYMTIADEDEFGFGLMKRIDSLRGAARKEAGFSGLEFPMIDLDETKPLDWLVGLSTGKFYVAAAAQQTKFKMNHTGARVKDAVTLVMRKTCIGPQSLVIDRPFYLWIERPGVGKPIIYAYLDETVWKDPGSLDM